MISAALLSSGARPGHRPFRSLFRPVLKCHIRAFGPRPFACCRFLPRERLVVIWLVFICNAKCAATCNSRVCTCPFRQDAHNLHIRIRHCVFSSSPGCRATNFTFHTEAHIHIHTHTYVYIHKYTQTLLCPSAPPLRNGVERLPHVTGPASGLDTNLVDQRDSIHLSVFPESSQLHRSGHHPGGL